MGEARKDSKSMTYYLCKSTCDKVDELAARTYRNKSQTVEMLLEIGLRNVQEMGLDQSLPERVVSPRRQPGELMDREPKRPGPKARKEPEPVAEVVAEAPKPRGRKPKAKVEAEVEAPKPRARKPRAKAAA
jgi:hypothetical protein